ncbi:MAG: hypothetical protein JXB35_13730 [Anaerolineae bacterium]|nr:hypothetical protein [Anaerolineae bacterium]
MHLPDIFSDRQFKRAAIGVAALTLIMLIVNVFLIGGDAFIHTFNSIPDAPLAIIVTISAASIWRMMSTEDQRRRLWGGLVIGWALWALAEIIWSLYSILGQEVPYPSLADLFWVTGYIPMAIGLLGSVRTLPAKPTSSQKMVIWGVSAATVLIASIFVFIPIIQDFDPQLLLESALNLIYPLGDLFLLSIVWWLFFVYEKGDYGFAWRLLIFGFILTSFSDLIFTYAVWQDLYYPDMKANVISRLVIDFTYTLSYLIWALGIYALHILLREQRPVQLGIRTKSLPLYGHILIYLAGDNTVVTTSLNYGRFFGANPEQGKTLAELATIPQQDERLILTKVQTEGKITDLPIQVRDRDGLLHTITLCGLITHNPQGQYSGAHILLRIPVEDGAFDQALSQYNRSMARHVLRKSGSNYDTEIKAFLLDYYLEYIKVLRELISHEGGKPMIQALLDELVETSRKHNWQMQFDLQTILQGDYPLHILQEALPVLLDTAKQFASKVTDPQTVEASMQTLHGQFGEAVQQEVARYCKAENGVRFADSHDS